MRYLHNAAGQRVFRSEPAAEFANPAADTLGEGFIAWLKQRFSSLFAAQQTESGIGTVYVHGDGQLPSWALLGEYDNGSALGKGRTEYIWLPLEDGSAIPVGFLRNRRLYAVHTDHLGTPRLVTDDERRPVWQWPYSTFGDNKPTGPLVQRAPANQPPHLRRTEPIEFGLRFPGQHEDAEAGVSNNLFRWYQAGNGRYTQPDPIGLPGGLNRFIYVGGNPISAIDPMGLDYTGIRAFPTDTFIVLHTPRVPGQFSLPSYVGLFQVQNAPCFGICIWTDKQFEEGYLRGNPLLASTTPPQCQSFVPSEVESRYVQTLQERSAVDDHRSDRRDRRCGDCCCCYS